MRKTLFILTILALSLPIKNIGEAADIEKDLLLYLPLDEGKGDTIKDASKKGFEGKGVNTKWAKGKFGNALEFNGTDSHAEIPGGVIAKLPNNEITMIAWFKLTGHDGYDGIVSMTGVLAPIGGQCCQYRIMVNPAMNPFFDVGEHADVAVPGFTFELKTWYHYALTYDGKDVKIYVDGEVVHEMSKGVKLPEFETPVLLGTGEAPKVHPTQGIIDEVWIFNRALSKDEIKAIMEEGPMVLSVELADKLSTTWGEIKGSYKD
ncbi:TPA: LamG domain-containing protein [Candidatus Poribacteria bacterium]|nr:LamG domain-containing protein [Candidatus Poribacteria bacterium]